ncbi:Mu-like prophage protein gpG [uncultured Flavonifractor sp.]|nr:Mu-like prophage protein gpG [uncultured Flavonifractor sp.]
MAIIRDTLRPELERIKTELKALQALKIHVGIQGDADSYLLMIAGVHEYGATIRAKNVKNLAIPISREAEGKSPRDFQGLFFITSEEGHLFGVTDKGNGKFNFLFLLLPSVTIPERSFIRGSFDHGKNELAEACKAAINKIVLEGGTAREAAALIGERAAAMTQAYIMKGIDPPKSSITMETTKSGKPLYSTGRLYQSITYEIEEG